MTTRRSQPEDALLRQDPSQLRRLAHELNNQLSVILGNAELAAREGDLSASLRMSLDQVLHAARQADHLVQQMLVLGRQAEERDRFTTAPIPGPPSSGKTDGAGPGTGPRILYIDDEEALVTLARRMLTSLGYRISAFAHAEDGLAALRAAPDAFDLVVTDYNMPHLSGLQVAAAVSAVRPDLPVLITSGNVTDDMRARAAEAGRHHLVEKPGTIVELSALIQGVLQAAKT